MENRLEMLSALAPDFKIICLSNRKERCRKYAAVFEQNKEFLDRMVIYMCFYPDTPALESIYPIWRDAVKAAIACYQDGGKILVCGNGGSAADSEHIVGELLKGFLKKRPLPLEVAAGMDAELSARLQMGLPAVSLVSQSAIITAVANDLGADLIFAQQVMGLGKPGDILIGISTSGNAKNVCQAFRAAKSKRMICIAMTGEADSEMSQLADFTLKAPSKSTPEVQEYHIKLYHAFCAAIESYFFDE